VLGVRCVEEVRGRRRENRDAGSFNRTRAVSLEEF
jgi:hypothetical protein